MKFTIRKYGDILQEISEEKNSRNAAGIGLCEISQMGNSQRMDLRRFYRKEFLSMMKEFYLSPAVLHNIPEEHFANTLEALEQNSPYFDIYIFEASDGEQQDGSTFVTRAIPQIAGYGAVTKTYSNEAGGLCFWFDEIYIRENFRGQGLGSTFIQQVIAKNPHVKRFRLETEPENEKAVRLYKKLGFEPLEYNQFTLDR